MLCFLVQGYEDEDADVMGKLFGFLKPKPKVEDDDGGKGSKAGGGKKRR